MEFRCFVEEEVDNSYFNYILPEDKIAQRSLGSVNRRSESKLIHATANKGLSIKDHSFSDLADILREGDLIVLNNSKVLACRFFARLENSLSEIEVLLVRCLNKDSFNLWEALAKPMRKLKNGMELELSANVRAKILGRTEDKRKIVLEVWGTNSSAVSLKQLIEQEGSMPIPPYIRKGRADEDDKKAYQSVFAKHLGSIAAPTAGLHFTHELFRKLENKGIAYSYITLHVGISSFLPVSEPSLEQHKMISEEFEVPKEVWEQILETKKSGGRIIAVGTTTVRTLEYLASKNEITEACLKSETNIFIKPPYAFKLVDCIITNFHQPRSTHLLLVAAFIGKAQTELIYQHALATDYRFLSYGDAMLLERVLPLMEIDS